MKTKHVPGSDLTLKQKALAADLRAQRPMCLPGTNAIIVAREAKSWHAIVAAAAITGEVKPEQSTAFFDACGVAD